MRVTFNSQYRSAQASLERASSQLADAQEQVASGKRVSRPSDDPAASASAVSERAQLGAVEQYIRASDSVNSRLAVLDTVLSDMIDKITSAQSTATGVRGGPKTDAQREAAAREIEGIRASLLDDFNSMYRGTYLFAGVQSTTRPYSVGADGAVDAYVGSAVEVEIDIADERSVTVGLSGESIALGSDTVDVFALLDDLAAAARAGDSDALGSNIDALASVFDRVSTAQSRVGQDMQAVEAQKLRLEQMKISSNSRISKLEDVNLAEAISRMSQADTAYRAALGAIGTAGRVSLLDYLG